MPIPLFASSGGAADSAAVHESNAEAVAHQEAQRRRQEIIDEAETEALRLRLALMRTAEDEARQAALRMREEFEAEQVRLRAEDARRRAAAEEQARVADARRRAAAEEEAFRREAARRREAEEEAHRFNMEQRMARMMQEQAQAAAMRAQQAFRAQPAVLPRGGAGGGRCNGITLAGQRCLRAAQEGRRFCFQH